MLPVPVSSTHAANCVPAIGSAAAAATAAAAAAASDVHSRDLDQQFGRTLPQLEEVSRGGGSTSKPAPAAMRAAPVAQMSSCPTQCMPLFTLNCMPIIFLFVKHSTVACQTMHALARQTAMAAPVCMRVRQESAASQPSPSTYPVCMRNRSNDDAVLALRAADIHVTKLHRLEVCSCAASSCELLLMMQVSGRIWEHVIASLHALREPSALIAWLPNDQPDGKAGAAAALLGNLAQVSASALQVKLFLPHCTPRSALQLALMVVSKLLLHHGKL